MMRRTFLVLVPLALTTLVLGSCGSSSSAQNLGDRPFVNEQGKRAVTVEVVDNNFEPAFLKISTGTTVTFTVKGRNRHNVISIGDAFKSSDLLNPGDSVKVAFKKTGDFPLDCSLHGTPTSGMTGGIRVVD